MKIKPNTRVIDGRAEYFGYDNVNGGNEGKFWKKNNNVMKKSERNQKEKKPEINNRPVISSRKWNAKSQTTSSFSPMISISSRFRDRIEKACSTYSTADFKKEIFLLKRQIQRLQKEIFKKDKIIFETKSQTYTNKQSEMELMEAYRVANFYEGKVKQMELQIQKFRQTILKGVDGTIANADLSILFDQLRKQNEQLHGRLQEKNYTLEVIKEKCQRYESKCFELKRELTSTHRKYLDPVQKNLNQRFDRMFEMLQNEKPLDVKEQVYFHQLGYKVKQLEQKNQELKIEIDVLKNQLQDKNIQITQLYKQNFALKKTRKLSSEKYTKQGYSNKKTFQNPLKPLSLQNCKQNSQISSTPQKNSNIDLQS